LGSEALFYTENQTVEMENRPQGYKGGVGNWENIITAGKQSPIKRFKFDKKGRSLNRGQCADGGGVS